MWKGGGGGAGWLRLFAGVVLHLLASPPAANANVGTIGPVAPSPTQRGSAPEGAATVPPAQGGGAPPVGGYNACVPQPPQPHTLAGSGSFDFLTAESSPVYFRGEVYVAETIDGVYNGSLTQPNRSLAHC